MSSKRLTKARMYEAQKGVEIHSSQRPLFHLTPYVGWMNDPNGFTYFNGLYHLFYQYNPYDTVWGPMHWGHAVSKNLVDWEFAPAALAPDSKADKIGCFSGCAFSDQNKMVLFYTGVMTGKDQENKKADLQVQVLAKGDGTNFTKSKKNPVIAKDKLDSKWNARDFRDPKVIKEGNIYKAICVNRNQKGLGQIISFKSANLEDWEFDQVLLENKGDHGIMWECPDYISIDGQNFYIFSIQNHTNSKNFSSGNIAVYAKEEKDQQLTLNNMTQLDYGIDFYAHQTAQTPDGRTVLLAWLQNWDTCGYRTTGAKWFGQITVPRELSVHKGMLLQNPVRELETLRTTKTETVVSSSKNTGNDFKSVEGINGVCNDIIIEAECNDITNDSKLQIKFFCNKTESDNTECAGNLNTAEHYLLFEYNFYTKEIIVDRTACGSDKALLHRVCKKFINVIEENPGKIKFRFIQDRNSLELFAGAGELTISTAVYNPEQRDGIFFNACGGALMNITAYRLEK